MKYLLFLIIFIPSTTYALKITEIYPVPLKNEPEWIELYNEGEINLENWHIKDSKSSHSLTGTMHKFHVIKSPLSLNNNKDEITIINPAGKLVDTIKYQNGRKGLSYDGENWLNPTPFKVNFTINNKIGILNEIQAGAIIVDNIPYYIDENSFNPRILRTILNPQDKIMITYDENNILLNYKLIQKSPAPPAHNQNKQTSTFAILSLFSILAGGAYFLSTKPFF